MLRISICWTFKTHDPSVLKPDWRRCYRDNRIRRSSHQQQNQALDGPDVLGVLASVLTGNQSIHSKSGLNSNVLSSVSKLLGESVTGDRQSSEIVTPKLDNNSHYSHNSFYIRLFDRFRLGAPQRSSLLPALCKFFEWWVNHHHRHR